MCCDSKATRSSHAPQPFPCLELPPELRQEVYQEFLSSSRHSEKDCEQHLPDLLAVSHETHEEVMDTLRHVPLKVNIK